MHLRFQMNRNGWFQVMRISLLAFLFVYSSENLAMSKKILLKTEEDKQEVLDKIATISSEEFQLWRQKDQISIPWYHLVIEAQRKDLLEEADLDSILISDSQGRNALYMALLTRNTDILNSLISLIVASEHGTEKLIQLAYEQDKQNVNALDILFYHNSKEEMELFLQNGFVLKNTTEDSPSLWKYALKHRGIESIQSLETYYPELTQISDYTDELNLSIEGRNPDLFQYFWKKSSPEYTQDPGKQTELFLKSAKFFEATIAEILWNVFSPKLQSKFQSHSSFPNSSQILSSEARQLEQNMLSASYTPQTSQHIRFLQFLSQKHIPIESYLLSLVKKGSFYISMFEKLVNSLPYGDTYSYSSDRLCANILKDYAHKTPMYLKQLQKACSQWK